MKFANKTQAEQVYEIGIKNIKSLDNCLKEIEKSQYEKLYIEKFDELEKQMQLIKGIGKILRTIEYKQYEFIEKEIEISNRYYKYQIEVLEKQER